jgi:hypothetical protein
MPRLKLHSIGQIKDADIVFGDLTVFVGPQATGKSIALQFLKLLIDAGCVQDELQKYGLDWDRKLDDFFNVYFGEGMSSIWHNRSSRVTWAGKPIDLKGLARRKRKTSAEKLFFVPAQRVLALRDGWPRPFTDYTPGDPFAVREFSEKLRILMDQEFEATESLFPQERRLKKAFRALLQENLFANFKLAVEKSRSQKRLTLGAGQDPLPYMVWSAGQREFVPLLLGLYWLMPSTKVARRNDLEWVVIEEPEMGLHPKAISVVLLLILELLKRGYRVCVSTHSPQILELVWALKRLHGAGGSTGAVLDLFTKDQAQRNELRGVASAARSKKFRVYHFDRESGIVRDISQLDPLSSESSEANWGGLTEFSERANDAVARAANNA